MSPDPRTASRIALSALLCAVATLVSATAAAARPEPVVPEAPDAATTTGVRMLEVVNDQSSVLWQYALVALSAAALAAIATWALVGRSQRGGRSGLAPTAG